MTSTDNGATAESMRLHRLMMGYLSSKALFAAIRLGVFDALSAGPATAEEVASKVGLPERSARVLLLAVEGEQLVTRTGDQYGNAPIAETYLTSGGPRYLGPLAAHQESHFAKLMQLETALRDDAPVQLEAQYTGEFHGGPQAWARRWAEVFRSSSQLVAEDLATQAALTGRHHLVDLGCASAAYSMAFARCYPDLAVTAVDQPAVAEVAAEFVTEAGLAERIDVRGADIFTETFPDCDVVLLSHVIQGFSRERARSLLAHVHDWMPAGGRLIIHSHLPEQASQPFPYQFGLILLLNNNQGGEPHSQATTEGWLREIGFTDLTVARVSPISAALAATK